MTERPILFSGAMVRAILAGQKTQTRRTSDRWSKVNPGDRLWVRETFSLAHPNTWNAPHRVSPSEPDVAAYYRAEWDRSHPTWRPSIHMPRWASRLTLEIVSVRHERVRDISAADIAAEGVTPESVAELMGAVEPGVACNPQCLWRSTWAAINGAESWQSNPLVWAIEFRRVAS